MKQILSTSLMFNRHSGSWLLIIFTIILALPLSAQQHYSKVTVDKQMKDTFSFASQWRYSWEVFKDEQTGVFTKNSDEPMLAEDTIPRYYTASCTTNVQGGYSIHYCFASKQDGKLILKLSDGLPAYGSDFYLYIQGDSFYFKPRVAYPVIMEGQEISYQVTKQALTLNNTHVTRGNVIMGYMHGEFIETITVAGKGTKKRSLYIKGHIRTIL